MLKFPYGLCDFYRIQTENYFYVDRTNHIRVIEDFGSQLIFLRPRRLRNNAIAKRFRSQQLIHAIIQTFS
jgi:hypothetical protein